jgi:hypothetical protein
MVDYGDRFQRAPPYATIIPIMEDKEIALTVSMARNAGYSMMIQSRRV